MPNLYSELYEQQNGVERPFTHKGKTIHFTVLPADGNLAYHGQLSRLKTQRENERFEELGGKKEERKTRPNFGRIALLREKAKVQGAEFMELQRVAAAGTLLLGFRPAEWDGLEVSENNLRQLIQLYWVWVLVRDHCINTGANDDDDEREDAEKNSVEPGAGISDSDTDSASSGPEKAPATKSTPSS